MLLRGACIAILFLGGPRISAAVTPSAPGATPARATRWQEVRSDTRGVFSRRTLLLVSAGGAAAGIAAAFGDAEGASGALDRSDLDGISDAGNVYGNGLFLGGATLGVLGTGVALRSPRLTDLGWDLGESLAISGIAVTALKIAVGRTRPDGGKWSFPSGHTASAFSVVPVLARHVGWPAGVAAGVAGTFVGMGRMEDRRHYLSDVLFGAGIGLAAGYAVVREPEREPGLSLRPGAGSLALVARF